MEKTWIWNLIKKNINLFGGITISNLYKIINSTRKVQTLKWSLTLQSTALNVKTRLLNIGIWLVIWLLMEKTKYMLMVKVKTFINFTLKTEKKKPINKWLVHAKWNLNFQLSINLLKKLVLGNLGVHMNAQLGQIVNNSARK